MKKLLSSFSTSFRTLFHRWGALLILLALYTGMLGTTYLFFVTREGSIGQLLLSLALALVAPILFFVIQTMSARYSDSTQSTWSLFGHSLRDFWKLLVISMPIIIVALLAIYFLGKVETTNSPATTAQNTARTLPAAPAAPRQVVTKPQPVSWQSIAVTTVEYLLFLLVLPLASIHLWISAARDGVGATFKRVHRLLWRAFSPRAVIVYAVGFVVFAVVPYFLIVTRTPANSAWMDVGLLLLRLFAAVLVSLFGWVVTVGALANGGHADGTFQTSQADEGRGHVPAEA